MSTNEWITKIKAGDVVMTSSGGWGTSYTKEIVARLTNTQIVMESGRKFKRFDGWLVGGGTWSTSHLVEITPSVIERYELDKLKNWFGSMFSSNNFPSINVLRAMKKAYDENIELEARK